MKEKRQQFYEKIIAGTLIGLAFCVSVFILAANRYGVWQMGAEQESLARQEQTILDLDTRWFYIEGENGPNVGDEWTTDRYEPSSWNVGSGAFATEALANRENADVLLAESDRNGDCGGTWFFRTEFAVEDLGDITALTGKIQYKDAVLVYLNGSIVFAGNVPAGGYASNQEQGAAKSTEAIWEDELCITDLSSLQEKKNVLAVEIHQQKGNSRETYFCFPEFAAMYAEVEDPAPDTRTVYLEQGGNELEIGVNWMTESADFYEVQFLPVEEYFEWNRDFASVAETVLMGRTFLDDYGCYVNRAALNRLEANTAYYYRIARVGSAAGSELMTFRTGGRSDFSFVLLGNPKIAAKELGSADLWDGQIKQTVALAGEPDFFCVPENVIASEGNLTDAYLDYGNFRSPTVFKQIPSVVIRGNHEKKAEEIYDLQFGREDQTDQGDYCLTYLDMLLIVLNSNDMDLAAHRAFIEQTIENNPRRWVVVLMHHALLGEGEQGKGKTTTKMGEVYGNMFADCHVDLVISGQEQPYVHASVQKGKIMELNPSENSIYRKKAGESIYISPGFSCGNGSADIKEDDLAASSTDEPQAVITKIEILGTDAHISTFRLDNGLMVDSYILRK